MAYLTGSLSKDIGCRNGWIIANRKLINCVVWPGLGTHPGYRVSFPRIKRPERGFVHRPPPSVEVKERLELYLYSPSGPSWPVLGESLKTIIPYLLCLETNIAGYFISTFIVV
jgi:hypothetical protein